MIFYPQILNKPQKFHDRIFINFDRFEVNQYRPGAFFLQLTKRIFFPKRSERKIEVI